MSILLSLQLVAVTVLVGEISTQGSTSKNPLADPFATANVNQPHFCGTILNLQKMCKIARDANQFCAGDDSTLNQIYASWQQNEKKIDDIHTTNQKTTHKKKKNFFFFFLFAKKGEKKKNQEEVFRQCVE